MKTKISGRPSRARHVFLFDVDNTLLDNDRVIAELRTHLGREVGARSARQYWATFEQLRTRLGYADYLGALQLCRRAHPHELGLLEVSRFLLGYPFARRLFPGAFEAIRHVGQWGQAVVLSDGDVVFQPHKVDVSGLGRAVGGRVLVFVHKEQELAEVEARFPAEHYVLVDDKLRILAAVKRIWRDRVTTVFVRQGHYAWDATITTRYPAADLSVRRISDVLKLAPPDFGPVAAKRNPRR